MHKNLEIIFDTKPNGGCGCNCGCAGSSVVEDMNELIENLKEYEFKTELSIDVLITETIESPKLIEKINELLNNTNAKFRVNEENIEETLSNMLPIVALDGTILTAYDVPTLYDVVVHVEKNL